MSFDIVYDVLNRLNSAGYRAFLAGSSVYELMNNMIPDRFRILTSASPQQVKRIFRRYIDSGFSYKTLTVIENKTGYEITSGLSSECTDNRDLYTYLLHSDFTVNSLAYGINEGIIDFFGGMNDTKNKIIRCTSKSTAVFESDPSKMLRAIRCCAVLGCELSPETSQNIKNNASLAKKAIRERTLDDINRILLSAHPEYIEKAHSTGILAYIFPALDKCFGEPQKNKYHIYDVGEHIMHTLTHTPRDIILRWAALMHDIGKPFCSSTDSNGIIHFYGHHKESVRLAGEFFHKYHMDSETASEILTLIEYHDVRIDNTLPAVKHMLSRIGEKLFLKLLNLQYADNAAKNPLFLSEKTEKLNKTKDIYLTIINEGHPYRISDLLINSRDLIKMKCKAGHQINSILKTLLDEVMINPSLNNRSYLISRARKLIGKV